MNFDENIRVLVTIKYQAYNVIKLLDYFNNYKSSTTASYKIIDIDNDSDKFKELAIDIYGGRNATPGFTFEYEKAGNISERLSAHRNLDYKGFMSHIFNEYNLILTPDGVVNRALDDVQEFEPVGEIKKQLLSEQKIQINFVNKTHVLIEYILDGIAKGEFEELNSAIQVHVSSFMIQDHIIMLDRVNDIELIGVS